MPNWIEGTLKLRGKSEDLKRFFTEGLEPSTFCGEVEPFDTFVKFNFSDDYCCVDFYKQPHIKGTRRAFITGDCVEWHKGYDTTAVEVKQAWNFEPEQFAEISKKYNLDIRLYGFEMGMEFCQEIEIIGGEVTRNNVIEYEDWIWECPMPNLGG